MSIRPSRQRGAARPAMAWACAAAVATLAWPAAASTVTYDLGAGPQWRATDDVLLAQQWAIGNFNPADGVAATSPYRNSTTDPAIGATMWYCGAGGSLCPGGPDGGLGPTQAFFATSFPVQAGAAAAGVLRLIADDYVDLVVNDQLVISALLDQHKDANGQPVPLLVDLTPYLIAGRDNVVAMRAMDGYLLGGALSCDAGYQPVSSNMGDFCQGDNVYEYVAVTGSVTVVPEPPFILLAALLGVAAASLGRDAARGARRRSPAAGAAA
jgi:hypothetical protein